MPIVIVPNVLRDAINAKLDKAIQQCPGAEAERELLYERLLAYFMDYGIVPDFSLTKKGDEHEREQVSE